MLSLEFDLIRFQPTHWSNVFFFCLISVPYTKCVDRCIRRESANVLADVLVMVGQCIGFGSSMSANALTDEMTDALFGLNSLQYAMQVI